MISTQNELTAQQQEEEEQIKHIIDQRKKVITATNNFTLTRSKHSGLNMNSKQKNQKQVNISILNFSVFQIKLLIMCKGQVENLEKYRELYKQTKEQNEQMENLNEKLIMEVEFQKENHAKFVINIEN